MPNMIPWHQLVIDLNLKRIKETDEHPHALIERAELFHSLDGCTTEYEFLNLINALVIANKPLLCLETGTWTGYGSLAIASALEENGFGKLITLDVDSCLEARDRFRIYDTNNRIEFKQQPSLNFIEEWNGEPFDFVFIDSGITRFQEFQLLKDTGKIHANTFIVLHDASPYRVGPGSNQPWLSQFEEMKGITIPYSRGIRLIKI